MTLKLLIADDSATIQKIVALAFGCEDAIVECASDGDAAMDAIRRFQPDVVLADIFMPGLGGYELCARVKENPELSHIPVVLLTGTFEPFDEMEASRVKCDGHLVKPFDTSELVETVQSLARNRMTTPDSDTSEEAPLMDRQNLVPSSPEFLQPGLRGGLNRQVWDSFLGSDRILDLFDAEILKEAEAVRAVMDSPATTQAAKRVPRMASSTPIAETISEDTINLIVDRVMARMSAEVIREVAWEVVPEMSENIIRRTIEGQNKS